MKKIFSLLLSVILIFCLCACKSDNTPARASVNFYYKTDPLELGTGTDVITLEVRNITRDADDHSYIIEQYLNGARKKGCICPFPPGTTLEGFSLDETSATVILSPHLVLLETHELMLACVCLAKTIFDMTGMKSVQIGAEDNLLDNKPYITITEGNYELWDTVSQ